MCDVSVCGSVYFVGVLECACDVKVVVTVSAGEGCEWAEVSREEPLDDSPSCHMFE